MVQGGGRSGGGGGQPSGKRSHASSVHKAVGSTVAAAAPPSVAGAQHSAKKKRKLADKIIPPEIREIVPESVAYMNLLSFEQKLDATISRKKLDIQEALKRPLKVKRRLRIYVSHTFYAAKEPRKESDEASAPMWELRVEGRLLDDHAATTAAGQSSTGGATRPTPTTPQTKRKFSSFFKSLVIELDKDIYGPDNHLVEWHRTAQTNETDGFQVKRPGDRNVKCTILLLLDYQIPSGTTAFSRSNFVATNRKKDTAVHLPMKFKLHPRLAKVLGLHTETRPKIIEALWQYIKTHKLQDPVERDHINCDQYLEQIFNCRRMRFMEIPQRLQHLLNQPDPIVINHMITVEGAADSKKTACYDIDVEIEDPLKMQMTQFAMGQGNASEIGLYDHKIYETVEQINESKLRRDFYLQFADNPVEFIRKWLISQAKDLKTMTEIQSSESEGERTATFYQQSWVSEAVFRHIYRKVQQKRAELEQSLGVKNN